MEEHPTLMYKTVKHKPKVETADLSDM